MLTHRNFLADVDQRDRGCCPSCSTDEHGATLLFLPLAHVFARMIQIGVRARAASSSATPPTSSADQPTCATFRPTFVLAVPRVFEKVYNTRPAARPTRPARAGSSTRPTATADRLQRGAGRPAGPALLLRLQHALFDRLVYGKLRAALGGRCTAAISGGAPLGARLGHFFRGIGVTVLEGYGLTETTPAPR